MKNYKIFKHPDGRIEAVKQGWSWPAFFFGVIWTLIKRLWLIAGVLLVISILLGIIDSALQPIVDEYTNYYEYDKAVAMYNIWNGISIIISITIAIVLGVKGNSFRESNLLSRGYQLVNMVYATNPEMAIVESRKTQDSNNITSNNQSSNIVI